MQTSLKTGNVKCNTSEVRVRLHTARVSARQSDLKLCKNCENVSTRPDRGTIMLMTIADVSTDVLLTFINGPKGLKRVTWRKLLESSLAKKSS